MAASVMTYGQNFQGNEMKTGKDHTFTHSEANPHHDGETLRVFFIEDHGKDAGHPRYRLTMYYAPNFARTHFSETAAEHGALISKLAPFCYQDYEKFRGGFAETRGTK
jgi:hypothetical protein